MNSTTTAAPFGFRRDLHRWRQLVTPAWVAGLVAGARPASIRPGQQTVFYCGTGWRASLACFYAWLMNWQRIGVYDGRWCEWSADPANPVVRRLDDVGTALRG